MLKVELFEKRRNLDGDGVEFVIYNAVGHEFRVSIIPSKKTPADLYFDGISHTEFQNFVKIP